ncbi:MAG: hypothetical protein AAFV88_07130 [Planctomycetota bacterium]
MNHNIRFAVLLSLVAFAGPGHGQPPTENAPDSLVSDTNPLPKGLMYRQWCVTDYEREMYKEQRYGLEADLLRPSDESGLESDRAAKAEAVLNKMVEFLSEQETASFTLEYELNSQTTMGVIEYFNAYSAYDFEYAKPNRLKISDRRPRDEPYHWEIGSDGTYVLRTDSGSSMVEKAAPTLPALLRQETLGQGYGYLVDARGVMSFFDPTAMSEWNNGRKLSYCGTREFGSVTADYVQFELSETDRKAIPYKRLHLFIAQGEYPVPLLLVRDSDRPMSGYSDDAGNDPNDRLTRQRDTEWRFTNWRFNEKKNAESFRLTMPKLSVVDSLDDMPFGVKTSLPRFVGTPLPAFTAKGTNGEELNLESLKNGKHTVLFFWQNERSFLEKWKAVEAAEAKFGSDRVQTFALYIAFGANQQQTSQRFDSILDPETIAKAGIRIQPRLFDVTENRFILQAERGVTSERCAVVDPSGQIVNTQPGYGRFDYEEMVLNSVEGLLQSRDLVQEQRDSVAKENARQDAMRNEWDERFKTSWNR